MKFLRTFLVAAAFVISGVLAGCGDSQPTKPAATSAPAVQVQPHAQTPPARSTWPPQAPSDLAIAPNLLADNWVFVLDASGSMGSSSCGTGGKARMETAKDGAIEFASLLPENANLGLIVFSDAKIGGISEWIKLGTGNRSEFVKKVKGIQPSGGTPLYSSMKLGAKSLTNQAQMQRGYGTYNLVVVTDGEADFGENPTAFAKELVATTSINVYAIGFCVDGKHSLDVKGVTRYTSANNLETLKKGFQAMLVESESFADSKNFQ